MLQSILKLKGVHALTKTKQSEIVGQFGRICCEWCSDGTCNGWVNSPKTTCPFAAPCS
ncbi:hypothetical protein [Kordia jejudonensis]|uniref:hypothetical protein n=1 Tax=Kordia jejudonensis TaxID=1348245 RepID=UPI0012E0A602|nr:hypothetical protein [Kordia jejudonensis]